MRRRRMPRGQSSQEQPGGEPTTQPIEPAYPGHPGYPSEPGQQSQNVLPPFRLGPPDRLSGRAGASDNLPAPAQPPPSRTPYGDNGAGPSPTYPRHAPPQGGPARHRGRQRKSAPIIATVTVLILAAAGAGAYLLLRTHGTPGQAASSYLSAWERGRYSAMNKVSVNAPSSGLAAPMIAAKTQLGVRRMELSLGQVTGNGGAANARFTAVDYLASGHVWRYQGLLHLVNRHQRWLVNWSPSAIYPGLRAGQSFSLSSTWPTRAPILAADGTDLTSPTVAARSGSIALLTGIVAPATAQQAKALGPPYKAGDPIGVSGLEQTYQAQLAGRPSQIINIVGPGQHVDTTAAQFAATPGTAVKTTIDLRVQLAASHAVSSAKTNKPVDIVAIQPSTGNVLAVVERPGGFDRALAGIFPPGSTFKVVTAAALAKAGMTPSSHVQCPSQVTIDGRVIHNANNEHLGATTLQDAFAISCNSTFAMLATQRLDGNSLRSMAQTFGFNTSPSLGVPATLGQFTTPKTPIDLAADGFGQGTDLVNPLSQAAVVAAVANGSWRPPRLVLSPARQQSAKPRPISPTILATLRPMMRAVVTSGTAAGVGFPAGVYGKTGTAEYVDSGGHTRSHGWFIGYRGDLAFAVLVEGGGFGANSAGPIAKAFLSGA